MAVFPASARLVAQMPPSGWGITHTRRFLHFVAFPHLPPATPLTKRRKVQRVHRHMQPERIAAAGNLLHHPVALNGLLGVFRLRSPSSALSATCVGAKRSRSLCPNGSAFPSSSVQASALQFSQVNG